MGTSILVHGVWDSSEIPYSNSWGRCLASRGIGIDDIRETLSLLRDSLVVDESVYVVIGPLDDATKAASDALLKTLEELPPSRKVVLWARDEDKVSTTVKSRVPSVYVSPRLNGKDTEEQDDEAFDLLEAFYSGDISTMVEFSGDEKIIPDFVKALSKRYDGELWEHLRPLLQERVLDADAFLHALLAARK